MSIEKAVMSPDLNFVAITRNNARLAFTATPEESAIVAAAEARCRQEASKKSGNFRLALIELAITRKDRVLVWNVDTRPQWQSRANREISRVVQASSRA